MYEERCPNDYNDKSDGSVNGFKPENEAFTRAEGPANGYGSTAGQMTDAGSGMNYVGSSQHGNYGASFQAGQTGNYSSNYNSSNTNYSSNTYGNNNNSNGSSYSGGHHYSYSGSSTYGAGSNAGVSGAGTGSSQMNQDAKKQRRQVKAGGYLKKVLAAVSLGLFFGICAGVGFFAVESASGAWKSGDEEMAAGTGQAAEALADNTADMTKTIAETAENLPAVSGTAVQSDAAVMDVSKVAAKVMPSIVSINNTSVQKMSYFGQTLESESTSVGSGIIVGESDTELLIVSNYHVVQDAKTLTVQFVDGSEAEAQMKGSDPDMDLAVIAVSLENVDTVTRDAIAVASLGDSDSLTVGEPAIAIGNALGYGQSVTVGVISAVDRVIDLSGNGENATDAEDGESFIQTDAAINPGNSGGALLNMKGEVIGINSNKIGGSVVEGMGYAIPISAAKPIIEDLMLRETREKVSEENKGYLGIAQLTVVDEMAEAYGMPRGVYVSQVYEGTGAQAAGIVKGNIITEFDGNKITCSEDLIRVLEYYSVGDTAEVVVMQGSPDGWESKTVTVTLGEKFE